MIGTKGFWFHENEYCEIVRSMGYGVFEFKSLDYPDDPNWFGIIDHFSPEVLNDQADCD